MVPYDSFDILIFEPLAKPIISARCIYKYISMTQKDMFSKPFRISINTGADKLIGAVKKFAGISISKALAKPNVFFRVRNFQPPGPMTRNRIGILSRNKTFRGFFTIFGIETFPKNTLPDQTACTIPFACSKSFAINNPFGAGNNFVSNEAIALVISLIRDMIFLIELTFRFYFLHFRNVTICFFSTHSTSAARRLFLGSSPVRTPPL